MTIRERRLLGALGAVVALVAMGLIAIRWLGGGIGAACRDSYSCSAFVFGGGECVDVGRGAYCTIYCKDDARCPAGWRCLSATPTVLTIVTDATDRVCIRDP